VKWKNASPNRWKNCCGRSWAQNTSTRLPAPARPPRSFASSSGKTKRRALVRLNQKLNANLDLIPPGASPPLVKPRSIDDVPILGLTFWSKRYADFELRRIAAQVDDTITDAGRLGGGSDRRPTPGDSRCSRRVPPGRHCLQSRSRIQVPTSLVDVAPVAREGIAFGFRPAVRVPASISQKERQHEAALGYANCDQDTARSIAFTACVRDEGET
jgi:hypothetical protein